MSELTFEKSDTNPTLDLKFKPRVIKEGKTKIVETYQEPSIDYKNIVQITTKDILTANDGIKQDFVDVSIDKTNQTCNVFKFLNFTV